MTKFEEFEVGDRVFLLRKTLELPSDSYSIFYSTSVEEKRCFRNQYSYRVRLPNGEWSGWVNKYKMYRSVGLLVLEVGDFCTENLLLDPLYDGVVSYFRMLLADGELEHYKIRTQSELEMVWTKVEGKISHVVIIGHGERNGISFCDGNKLTGSELGNLLDKSSSASSQKKFFFSLCCHTGHEDFGRDFSLSDCCKQFTGPTDAIYGPFGLLYCELFFSQSFINHDSRPTALIQTNDTLSFMPRFESWMHGRPSVKFSRTSKKPPLSQPT